MDLEFSQGLGRVCFKPLFGVGFVRMDQLDIHKLEHATGRAKQISANEMPKLGIAIFSRLFWYCTRFGGWEKCSKENVPRRTYIMR